MDEDGDGGRGNLARDVTQRGTAGKGDRARSPMSLLEEDDARAHGDDSRIRYYTGGRRGARARAQRNAFPGVYLTVPRYIRQMIDRHQCFSTNAPYPVPYSPDVASFFFSFFYLLLIVLSRRPSARLPVVVVVVVISL